MKLNGWKNKGAQKMPILEISNFKDIEFYMTPDNPAIRQARNLINRVCIPRAKKEDQLDNLLQQQSEFAICCQCRQRGNKNLHHKEEMMLLERESIRKNGKRTILKSYYCKEHASKYKPQSERVGCGTY